MSERDYFQSFDAEDDSDVTDEAAARPEAVGIPLSLGVAPISTYEEMRDPQMPGVTAEEFAQALSELGRMERESRDKADE